MATTAAAAKAKADPSDRAASSPMPVDPAVRLGLLDNGLRYYVRKHGKPEQRAALRLVVNAGSVLETDAQRGLAHFVEHMAFNGTRLFRKQQLVDYLERVGMRFGSDANASTSFDETTYTFTVPTDDPAVLAKAFLIMQQIASEVSFDPGEVDRERGVVIEEWRQGLGAEMRVMEQILPVVFARSRYAERMPIGKNEILEKARSEDLKGFYQRWYRPDLMAVVAVGDFDPVAVERQLRETFGSIPKPSGPANRPVHPVPDHAQTLVAVGQDPELPSTSVGVLHTMPRRPDASEGDYRRHIVESLYHQMLNDRLEEQTRSEAPPFLGAVSTTQNLVRPTDVFAQIAAVKQDGIAQGLKALTIEVERVQRHGFTAGELARAKAEQLRRMQALEKERANMPADSFADEMVRHYLTAEAMPGIQAELRLHERYLPTVTVEEMNGVARNWMSDDGRVILVQAPKAVTVPTRDALLGVFKAVEASNIPAYVDRAADGPLLASLPPPGRIEKETRIDELGVTEWRLSNGVRVVLKPTEFKKDELLLAGFSPGGTSLVSDRDFRSAQFAASIVDASGAGNLDPTALRNALAGKLVDATPFIQELEEGVLGRASPEDLETFLQLLFLKFTAPRRDDRVFAAFRAQLAEQLAHRNVDPEAVFGDKLETVMYDNHVRRRPLQPGDEQKIALDRVLNLYRDRFSKAGDFTFVIVGSFTPDALAPLVTKYLAALPGRASKPERWKDRGVRPVSGLRRFEVRQGVEPKSLVSLTFTGNQRWSREEDHLLDSLVEAIGIRLREVLREDMGGTYSVNVSGGLQRRPFEGYRVGVTFSCAPGSVDKLVEAVFREIEAAKTGSLGAPYLEKVQSAQRRALAQATRTNGFWIHRLLDHTRYGTDPRAILREQELIAGLTAPRITQAAGRYFDRKRYVLGVLRPGATATPPAATSLDAQPKP